MIIKRYSQKQFTFTGRDLVEKLYSEGWKVEQKEYGLKSAAISGIKKVGKLIAKKLDDSSKLDSEKLKKINESLKSVAKDRNPEVLKNIGKDAKKSNIKILNGKKKLSSSEKFFRKRFDKTKSWEKKSSDVSTKEKIDLTRSNDKFDRKLGKAFMSSDHVINFPPSSGQASLAHEIGHSKNSTGKGLDKIISDKNNDIRGSYSNKNKRVGIRNGLKTLYQGSIVVQEEKSASKKALKLLKAAGASKDELKNAKEELDLSLKTYKIGRNKAIKDSISKRLKGFKKTKTM